MQRQTQITKDNLINCKKCSRLVDFLQDLKTKYPEYHNRPVAPFGDPKPNLLIVGLAPGMHGANATGRPFTGDYAGILLYKTLYDFGFTNMAESRSIDDGLVLKGVRITNAVKCLPPKNQPQAIEINSCNLFLSKEIMALKPKAIILALGLVAHKAIIKALGLKQKDFKFAHKAVYQLPNAKTLIDSYHCSRYNTQTRRLTPKSFREVFLEIEKTLRAK